MLDGLDRFASITKKQDICAVVFIHTRLNSLNLLHPFRRIYAQVADAARARGLHVIESADAFMGHRDRDLWVDLLDMHPNAEGHEILADALVAGLRDLPRQCWKGRDPWHTGAGAH